jgi:hypothetical protein
MESAQLNSSVESLLSGAGIVSGKIEISSINGGGNNRVFAVQTEDEKYLAKVYYRNAADTRNRLGAEYSFLSYAWESGLRCVPRPISCDTEKNMGLYEFVEGRKLTASELTRKHIIDAAQLIRKLNARPNRDKAVVLPVASAAGFSVEQHFSRIDRRIRLLRDLPVMSESDRNVLSFVLEIQRSWEEIKDRISAGQGSMSMELDADDRCISPSDFGFHNALLRDSGEICFIDFEYAGWDDPAKMAGDFFSQPAIPASLDHFDVFLHEALIYSPNKEVLATRAHLLLPIFQLEWCCIMLNEFLPDAAKRRQFANPSKEPEQSKRLQLVKAQQFFNLMFA